MYDQSVILIHVAQLRFNNTAFIHTVVLFQNLIHYDLIVYFYRIGYFTNIRASRFSFEISICRFPMCR